MKTIVGSRSGPPEFRPGQEFNRLATDRNEEEIVRLFAKRFVGVRCFECLAHPGASRFLGFTPQGNARIGCCLKKQSGEKVVRCERIVHARHTGLRLPLEDPKAIKKLGGRPGVIESNTIIAWLADDQTLDQAGLPPVERAGPCLSWGGTLLLKDGRLAYPSDLGRTATASEVARYYKESGIEHARFAVCESVAKPEPDPEPPAKEFVVRRSSRRVGGAT